MLPINRQQHQPCIPPLRTFTLSRDHTIAGRSQFPSGKSSCDVVRLVNNKWICQTYNFQNTYLIIFRYIWTPISTRWNSRKFRMLWLCYFPHFQRQFKWRIIWWYSRRWRSCRNQRDPNGFKIWQTNTTDCWNNTRRHGIDYQKLFN